MQQYRVGNRVDSFSSPQHPKTIESVVRMWGPVLQVLNCAYPCNILQPLNKNFVNSPSRAAARAPLQQCQVGQGSIKPLPRVLKQGATWSNHQGIKGLLRKKQKRQANICKESKSASRFAPEAIEARNDSMKTEVSAPPAVVVDLRRPIWRDERPPFN